ncbi:protein mono-ADP-ribosyltransferase PARP12-like [Patiria miniata]|uniref:Uncharacterized protein n=1 Tax=Patiria miniata TaxID=46514 RepID=A0A914BRM5_PATMI|nr:protein mono-ADP-ribosyltransferase PARP12-like [Patiria miniata]XP_038078616.1 protein mono-ADP-ribosyltransferase PARP12-like [Patiria miniata]
MAAFHGANPVKRKSKRQVGAMIFPEKLELQILNLVCMYGGSVSLTALNETLMQEGWTGLSDRALRQFMTHSSPHNIKLFHLEEDPVRNECTVRVKTDAVLCETYDPRQDTCEEGSDCESFHLCSHFVLGSCERGRKCVYPHHLRSPHNDTILFANGLEQLDDGHIFQIFRQSWIKITVPDVCRHYNTQTGCTKADCQFLHVCRHYILGDCKFASPYRKPCYYSHNVKDPQPMSVWRRFHINAAAKPPGELLQMLLEKKRQEELSDAEEEDDDYEDDDDEDFNSMRSPTRKSKKTVPDVCIHYNRKGCNKGDKCPYLHICRFYATGNCRFTGKCRHSHNAKGSQPMAVWQALGIDARSKTQEELLALIQTNNPSAAQGDGDKRRRRISSLQGAASDNLEICEYNLRGKCNFGDGCRKLHSDQHYQWQYSDDNGQTWKNVDLNVTIEEKFCDIRTDGVKDQARVLCFKTMKLASMDVRRLETPSTKTSQLNSWQSVLATKWQWYFHDNGNIWVQYANNAEIEEAYQKFRSTGQDPTFKFETEQFRYVLDFPSMTQKNRKLGTKREVRRRPKFVSKDMCERSLQKMKVLGVILPKNWDAHLAPADPQSNFVLSKLDRKLHAEEHKLVSDRFAEKMNASSIVRIERVQNNELWHEFTVRRDYMRDRQVDSRKVPAELMLFHGTEKHVIEAICQQNFDHRVSGSRVGTKYGQGSYFSKSAKYSDAYASPDSKGRGRMFLVRVLVGSYTRGDPKYRRPPLRDTSKLHGPLFDSCVDNPIDPLIFVIFDRNQVYPEYLITYKK